MGKLEVLWVDLRADHEESSYCCLLREDWRVSCISSTDYLSLDIGKGPPTLLCFEFDYPDIPGLTMVRQIRRMLPALPIILLTEQHSESLAVWALRARVWDYLVKPFPGRELNNSVAIILTQNNYETSHSIQQERLPNPLPAEVRFRPCYRKRTYPALAFVENHAHEKIYEKKVAELCAMTPTVFSRCFKKEHGITFRDYLIRHRIKVACGLLQNPKALVTDIAYAAGFHDPSYFARTFRRFTGISPSSYRKKYKNNNSVRTQSAQESTRMPTNKS